MIRGLRSFESMSLRLGARIGLGLCAIATLATLLTLVAHRSQLAVDLEEASRERLTQAAVATVDLLADLEEHLRQRHRAIARTPEFRANLETGDVATLHVLAKSMLDREESIDSMVFTNSGGLFVASAGNADLVSIVLARSFANPDSACGVDHRSEACSEIVGPGDSILSSHDGQLVLGTSIPLMIRGRSVGRVAFVELQETSLFEKWARLSGAEAGLRAHDDPIGPFEQVVTNIPPMQLRVQTSFDLERAALERLRTTTLTAGLFALFVAFIVAVLLTRGLVAPLHEIESAASRIAGGDRTVRIRSQRRDEFGDVARAFDTMLDHLESAEIRLERSQRIGRLGSWSQSEGNTQVTVSRQLKRILGLDGLREVVEMSQILCRIHPENRAGFETALKHCETTGTSFDFDHRVVHPDGTELMVHTRGERIGTKTGGHRVEGTIQDVTERKQIEEQVRVLAYHDGLTGLGNRRLFADELERAIGQSQRVLAPLAVLFLDLDDFKVVNDTLGHGIGDKLLCIVADHLCAVVEEMEIDAPSASVHRLGGDEFAVILPELGDWEAASRCAQAILRRLTTSVDLDGYDVQISASVGIATWPDEGLDVDSILLGCDTAMYHAKVQGRGLYRFYDPSMREVSERRLRMEGRLRKAISRDELEVVYQPKVEPISGRVVGLEALLRWRDRDLGSVSPEEFVALAEETGQILALGEWVLVQVAQQACSWMKAGLCDVPIAVNVSSWQIEAETLLDTVVGILHKTGFPPSHLELEVTESALLKNEERAIDVLSELKAAGVKLALDDFGTGYSSLGYLRRLPIDTVKIDRSFVVNIVDDAQDRALVESIISMAHAIGLDVVVEGIEEEAQRDILVSMGCVLIQGYFYSEGVAAERIPEIVARGFAPHSSGVEHRPSVGVESPSRKSQSKTR